MARRLSTASNFHFARSAALAEAYYAYVSKLAAYTGLMRRSRIEALHEWSLRRRLELTRKACVFFLPPTRTLIAHARAHHAAHDIATDVVVGVPVSSVRIHRFIVHRFIVHSSAPA